MQKASRDSMGTYVWIDAWGKQEATGEKDGLEPTAFSEAQSKALSSNYPCGYPNSRQESETQTGF